MLMEVAGNPRALEEALSASRGAYMERDPDLSFMGPRKVMFLLDSQAECPTHPG